MICKGNSKIGLLFILFAIVFNTSTAQSITGVYSNAHTISYLDNDGWVQTEVSDSLILTELENNSLQFEFFLIHTNGHACSMDGVAAKVDSAYEYIEMFD